ncbi:MAG: SusC/RagA family TonB-linked outer membrane protein, partial [Bacteroidales bacterium]|nr:SusC/RagA family TonB-linked outer membrane protein [Bacteroidales bacterium]
MNLKSKVLAFLFVLTSVTVFAQTKTITGTVKDDQGAPLPGVTVVLEGTTQGTITDLDGKYSISAQPTDQLKFSFIGFKVQLILVGDQSAIDVTLLPDVESIDEVVVVGYGIQKKESVVGAITQAKGEDLKKTGGLTNLTDALSGQMAGVTVLQSTGIPGGSDDDNESSQIFVRGQSTWNGGQPLILVDGVERSMNDIDPNDIETISVLKDASATAVFGVKGGNGVVLITTKRGKAGKTKLTIGANMSAQTPSKLPQTLGSYDGFRLRNYAIMNEVALKKDLWDMYVPAEELELYKNQQYPNLYPSINYPSEMLTDWSWSQKVNMNVSGGNDFVTYFGSLAYLHEDDIMNTLDFGQGYDPNFEYNRFNYRSNLDFAITKTTKFSMNLAGYFGIQQKPRGAKHEFWKSVYGFPHDIPPVQYEDGTFSAPINGYERFANNPVYEMNMAGATKEKRNEITTDFEFTQKLDFITKGLSFKAKLSYDNYFQMTGPNIVDEGAWRKTENPALVINPDGSVSAVVDTVVWIEVDGYYDIYGYTDRPPTVTAENIANADLNKVKRDLYYLAQLNYNRKFGRHSLGLLAVFTREKNYKGIAINYNRSDDEKKLYGYPQKREDYVFRLTYDFNDILFLDGNGAYNGSTKFGPGYKFDFFPSAAAGVMISNLKPVKENLPFLNTLKLRGSLGIVGNDNLPINELSLYRTRFSQHPSSSTMPFGESTLTQGPILNREEFIGNPDVQWEVVKQQNIGVDFGIFQNLLSGEFNYFTEHRTQMLVAADDIENYVDMAGGTPPPANIGEVDVKGFEIQVKFSKSHSNSLRYWLTANYTKSIDEIISKADPAKRPDYQKLAGHQIDQTTTYMHSSIIQTWDEMYTG